MYYDKYIYMYQETDLSKIVPVLDTIDENGTTAIRGTRQVFYVSTEKHKKSHIINSSYRTSFNWIDIFF